TFLGVHGLVDDAYERMKFDFPVPSLLQADPSLAYYTALNLPTVIASTLGQTAPLGSQASLFNAPLSWQTAAAIRGKKHQEEARKAEAQRRARLAGQLPLAWVAPPLTRVGTWWAATEVNGRPGAEPPPLPAYASLAALRYQVLDEAAATLAQRLL